MLLPLVSGILLFIACQLAAEEAPPLVKEPPQRPSFEAHVRLEEFGFLDDCPVDKICVEGQLFNSGEKTAYAVRLAVEIGGTKHSKPRVVLPFKVDQTTMNPGDRQDIILTLDRKVKSQQNGKEKVVEVGRYNFKVVPKWSRSPAPAKKPIKSR